MKAEIERRESFTAAVLALFKSRPREWIDWTELAAVGGRAAWRTRISEARQMVEAEGGVIENQQSRHACGAVISTYRYLPQTPLGRDAGTPIAGGWLFDVHQRG